MPRHESNKDKLTSIISSKWIFHHKFDHKTLTKPCTSFLWSHNIWKGIWQTENIVHGKPQYMRKYHPKNENWNVVSFYLLLRLVHDVLWSQQHKNKQIKELIVYHVIWTCRCVLNLDQTCKHVLFLDKEIKRTSMCINQEP